MSRYLVKVLYTAIISIVGIVGISAACSISPNAGWEYAYADMSCKIPDAISTTKRVIDEGKYYQHFLTERDSNIRYMNVPTNVQRAEYNAAFTGLVYNIWYYQNRKSSSKLSSTLQGLLQDMRTKYRDESLTPDQRTKFAYLYYLSFETIKELKGTVDTPINGTTNPNNNTPTSPTSENLTFIQTYYTLNGNEYSLRHSDIFYLFSRGRSEDANIARRARSLDSLINYMEFQNRVVVRAQNGRVYAIWKHNMGFKISRDNGSVLPQTYNTYEDAKIVIDTCAVTTAVPSNMHAICGFDSYGK